MEQERAADRGEVVETKMENQKKILYKCDPNKNTQCKKSGCVHNKNSVYPVCDSTSHMEFSTDGIPLKDMLHPRSK